MKTPSTRDSRGFALIVTVTLLVLLSAIALGFLSLSAVTLRSGTQDQAQAEARANARLALQIAIGELQKQLGPDQRISANGDILDDPKTSSNEVRHRYWTGVWNSWKAGDGISSHSTISDTPTTSPPSGEISPPYQQGRSDSFRSWLVSLNPAESANWESAKNLTLMGDPLPIHTAEAVRLVGDGSLGKNPDPSEYVSARLMQSPGASGGAGRYAWWVGDESQKSKILSDSYQTAPAANHAEKILRSQAPDSTGTRAIQGLSGLTAQDEIKLSSLTSKATLDLIPSARKVSRNGTDVEPSKYNFHHTTPYGLGILADVREGGLKRDLNTLLERPINRSETGNEFMLYRFGGTVLPERVSIHDLSAFYQLYDQSSNADTWRRLNGVQYSSTAMANTIHVIQPDMGLSAAEAAQQYSLQYSRIYQSIVPIKIQLLLCMTAHAITPAPTDPNADTHFIRLQLMPAVTLWNPTNLPVVMNRTNNNLLMQQMRFQTAGFNFHWRKNGTRVRSGSPLADRPLTMAYCAYGNTASGRPGWDNSNRSALIFDMFFATAGDNLRFEPGEVRVFSYTPPNPPDARFVFNGNFNNTYQAHQRGVPGWNPNVALGMANSIWGTGAHVYPAANGYGPSLSAKLADTVGVEITTDLGDGTDYAHDIDFNASAIGYNYSQKNFSQRATGGGLALWTNRHYFVLSRTASGSTYGARINAQFNDGLVRRGFPASTVFQPSSVSSVVELTNAGTNKPILQYALMAGTETHESQGTFAFGGRKFAARPFLHSSVISSPNIDQNSPTSLYNHGLSWWVQDIGSVLEANIQVEAGTNRGYFGGGHSATHGTTHVIQQEVPVVPPISVAALNKALLGGYTLGSTAVPSTTAPVAHPIGTGGMSPFTVSAIGNSYAHPNIPSNNAYTINSRVFNGATPSGRQQVFVDHSYLANKALWDDCFFSSITPQRTLLFGTNRTATQVASDFLDPSRSNPVPLPNRRLQAYQANLDAAKLSQVLSQSSLYSNGMADKIAAHLLVDGSFNVNSTSVEAWRVLFSSLKGVPITYLDRARAMSGMPLVDASTTGVTASGMAMPLTAPSQNGYSTPNNMHQWVGAREITDAEIDALAQAIVAQVKARGPFLSLSEFVNRRLEPRSSKFAAKGALQAALDYSGANDYNSDAYPGVPEVPINKNFRTNARQFTPAEKTDMASASYPEAVEGPVAYGSNAYVDQADLLRNLSEQLSPRGDTFVIRAYGDSISGGDVKARAWCEAVVQRLPDYSTAEDEPHEKFTELSNVNMMFGRKLSVISFRWLDASEV